MFRGDVSHARETEGGPGSPIFLYIGGEGPESCYTLQPGVMLLSQLAKTHKALMVDIEHRYYGESYPTTNMSSENLAMYLTSEQALADLYVPCIVLARVMVDGYFKSQCPISCAAGILWPFPCSKR